MEAALEIENPFQGADDMGNEAGPQPAETTVEAAPNPEAADAPNIRYVGEGEPPTAIQHVAETITLPSVEIQEAGPFYHAEAKTLCRLFPQAYKRFQRLGDI